jgi:vitamin B12 transporter
MNRVLLISSVSALVLNSFAVDIALDEVVVTTPTKSKQSIKDVTSNITVISGEELRDRHVTTISEALSSIGGMALSQSGGIGQQTSLFLRGFSSDSLLLLIDGVNFNDPTTIGGSAQLEHILASDVERIEVIKSAQSGIYGANASAGVINIITKKATKKPFVSGGIEGGSFGTKSSRVSIGQKIDKLSFYTGYSYLDTKGFSSRAIQGQDLDSYEDDGYSNKSFNTHISYELSSRDRFNIGYSDMEASVDYDNSITDQDGYTIDQKNKVLNTSFIHNYSQDSYSKVFYTRAKFLKEDPKGFTKRFEGENKEYGIDTKVGYNKDSFIFFGVNKSSLEDVVNSREFTAKGIYLTNSTKIDRTIVTATLRRDSYSEFEDETTGKFGIKHYISSDLTISSNYANAYKTPSLYEYNLNSSLTPESVDSFDIGFGYRGFNIVYFNNKITDEILYSSSTFSYYNSKGESKIRGYEFSYKNIFFEDLLFGINYIYFDAKDEDGYQLAKRPKSITSLSLDYYALAKTHINLNAQHIGKRVEYNWGSHDIKQNTGRYTVANLAINYDIKEDLRAYLKVNNLTNREYQSTAGYATSPRAIYMGMDVRF